jgi:hypothetical protein
MPVNSEFAKELDEAISQIEKPEISDAPESAATSAEVGSDISDSTKVEEEVDESEKDAVPVNTQEAEPETAPEAPTSIIISDSLLTEAVKHGIPVEDAKLFPSDTALERAIKAVRESIEKFAPKEEKKSEPDEDLFSKIPKLDPEQFEPEVLQLFDSVLDVVKKQQEQLKELRKQTEQGVSSAARIQQQAAEQEIVEWFDGQIVKLGDEFKDVLGVGGTDSLPPSGPHKAKRDAIANQAAILFAGYAATGAKVVSRDDIFTAAAKMVLADDYAKLHEKKLSNSLAKRSKQHMQKIGVRAGDRTEDSDPVSDTVEKLKRRFPKLA